MAGRHSAPSRFRSRRPLVVALIVIGALLLAGGGTAWALVGGPAGTDGNAAPVATTKRPSPVPTPILDCRESVQAGDAAVGKAYQSYKDWYVHVQAQVDLDKNRISVAKARKIWDKTHARGSSDMNAFDAQRIVYERQEDACDMVPADLPDKYTDAVNACQKRADAIGLTMAAGLKVGNEWMDHVLKERDKKEIDPYDYHKMWIKAVKKAPKALGQFRTAYTGYKRTPKCVIPKSE